MSELCGLVDETAAVDITETGEGVGTFLASSSNPRLASRLSTAALDRVDELISAIKRERERPDEDERAPEAGQARVRVAAGSAGSRF